MSTTTPTSERENLHGSEGVDFYNPGQRDYQDKFSFDSIAANLKDVEESGNRIINDHNKKSPSVRDQELEPTAAKTSPAATLAPKQKSEKRERFNFNSFKKILGNKKLRGKSSLATLLLVLFGGGGFLTVFFSPSLAVINMKEMITENLNDQLHVMDERSTMLLRSKLKDMTNGSCGAVKIKCRFATISDKQVEKFRAAGIEIKTTPKEERSFFSGSRGQILEMSYVDSSGVTTIKSAEELHQNLLSNVPFRSAIMKGRRGIMAAPSVTATRNSYP